MRSERPKPIHLDLRPADGGARHHGTVRARASHARWSWSATAPTGSSSEVQEEAPRRPNVAFVEQRDQRGTGDAVIVGMTALHDDRPRRRLDRGRDAGRHAAAAPRDRARPGARARVRSQRRHRALGPHGRPDRLRPGHPRARRARGARSSSSATPHPRSSPSTRWARASTRSAATSSARRCAASPPTTRRASTTSPTSSACWPGPGHRSRRHGRRRPGRDAGRKRPRPSSPWPKPSCGPARTGTGC